MRERSLKEVVQDVRWLSAIFSLLAPICEGSIMTQELIDLRTSILEGRYADALAIVDELEGMSKIDLLFFYLAQVRFLIYLR